MLKNGDELVERDWRGFSNQPSPSHHWLPLITQAITHECECQQQLPYNTDVVTHCQLLKLPFLSRPKFYETVIIIANVFLSSHCRPVMQKVNTAQGLQFCLEIGVRNEFTHISQSFAFESGVKSRIHMLLIDLYLH